MSFALETEDLHLGYGKVAAVEGVSIRVDTGSIVSIVGPNGAGKSTLLNSLMGLHGVLSGGIKLDGQAVTGWKTERRLQHGLSLVPEKRELFVTMTVEDNLKLGAFRSRVGLSERLDDIYDSFPRLKERRTQIAGTMSGGERQMLALGRALMSNPRVLMLDEPSLGLAPRVVADVLKSVTMLKARGISILLVEQNAKAALAISDYAYVLELGQVVLEGAPESVSRNERITAAYLGEAS